MENHAICHRLSVSCVRPKLNGRCIMYSAMRGTDAGEPVYRRLTKTLLVMKLTFLLLTVALLQVRAAGISQTINLSAQNISLERIFGEIETQTGYYVAGDKDLLKTANTVSVSVRNMPLASFLQLVLKNQPLDYKLESKTIFITSKRSAETDSKSNTGGLEVTTEVISGIVQDKDGRPLAGATIAIEGNKIKAVTNTDGRFSMTVETGTVVVVSSVGYVTQRIKLAAGINNLVIVMAINLSPLDEMQIIAYGQTTRRMNTGNTTTVKAEEIARQPVNNVLLALQGRVPGMQITPVNSSLPGSSPNVKIRGINSIAAGTSPLYILDGVPIAENQPSLTLIGSISGLMNINPGDVESIDVLKDAEATALYGSRGANGVILITTKKGKAGKVRLSLNAYTGYSELGHRLERLDVHQYLAMRREALANMNITPTASNAPDLFTWDSTKVTDWQETMLGKSAPTSDVNLSVSGGSNTTHYLVNAGYHTGQVVFPGNTGDARKSVRLSVDHTELNGKFSISGNAAYSQSLLKLITVDLTTFTSLAPHYAMYTPDGTPNWAGTSGFPLAYLLQPYRSDISNYTGNINLRYTLFRGLNLKLNSSILSNIVNQSTFSPAGSQNPATNPSASSTIRSGSARTWVAEPQAEYAYAVKQHSFKLLAGGTFQQAKTLDATLRASGFSNDNLLGNISLGQNISVYNSQNVTTYASFFSRLTYDFRQEYLLNVSFRRDGSSRFGPGKRFGNFGAVSGAWIFTENNAVQKAMPFLSFGKLRASYGINGNDQTSDLAYVATYGSGLQYQGPTLSINGISNPDYRWEENRKLETGLELGFLKDRILFSASWFRNRTDNQLIFFTLPPQTGASGYTANFPALLQNTGWEFEVKSRNITTQNFSWQTSAQLSASANKLLEFPGISNTSYNGQYIVGQPLSVRQAYRYKGLSNTGIPVLEDIDKSNSITSADRYVVGNSNPLFGSLSNDFTFKNFHLGLFFEYTRIRNFNNAITAGITGGMGSNPTTMLLDRWQKPGDEANTNTPKFLTSSALYNARFFSQSDLFWGTTNIVRLRNMSVSYDLPDAWLKKAHIAKLQLYALGENLWVGDKYRKYRLDPETGNSGLPPLRIITFGINCTL